jgi:hypothetical protein
MINEKEIEALATKLADLGDGVDDGSSAEGFALIAHLENDDLDAVLSRAEDILFDRNLADHFDSAASLMPRLVHGEESLMRLLHATGCPDDKPMLPWLEERGVAVRVADGWRFKLPKPGAVK